MPPESLAKNPVYGSPMDVFSFAGIILHTFIHATVAYSPTEQVQFDPKTRKMMALSKVKQCQQYMHMDKVIGEAEVLRPLMEKCLDYDPAMRLTIATICERIQVSKDVYMKECPQDFITVLQQMEKQKMEIEKLRNENEQMRTQMVQV